MRKILDFLIQFINDTDLDDDIKIIIEPKGDDPDVIIIRRMITVEEDE